MILCYNLQQQGFAVLAAPTLKILDKQKYVTRRHHAVIQDLQVQIAKCYENGLMVNFYERLDHFER